MTTVAYRDGVLAADRLVTFNGRRVGEVTKAFRFGRVLVGCTGGLAKSQQFVAWMKGGAVGDPPDMAGRYDHDDAVVLVVLPGDLIVTFDKYGADVLRAPWYAAGTGGPIATGALAAGASAEEAVRLASAICVNSGAGVDVVRRDDGGA